jgi:tetratricopeptide (TPR) repeat protein
MSRVPLLLISIVALALALPVWGEATGRRQLEQRLEQGLATRAEILSLGAIYLEAGRSYEASKLAERLLALDSQDVEATALASRAKAALAENKQRRVAEAESAAKRPGASDENRLAYADALFSSGAYEDAVAIYRTLPQRLRTRDNRLREARSLAWRSRHDGAEQIYRDLVAEHPGDDELELEYGRLLSWMGAYDAATQRLNSLYSRTKSTAAAIALSNVIAWSDQRAKGVEFLQQHVDRHPDDSEARTVLDEMLRSPALRLERLEALAEREPYNLALGVERARLLVENEQHGRALRVIESLKSKTTSPLPDLEQLERKARTLQATALEDALQRRRQLDISNPSNAGATLKLAKKFAGLQDHKSAIELYEQYLKSNPSDMEARLALARVFSWGGRYAAAEREYRRVLESRPDRLDVQLEYAKVLSQSSKYIPAVRTLRTLTDLSSNERADLYTDVPAEAHFNLGRIYRWYGWLDQAAVEQNAALAHDAGFRPAQDELARVARIRPATRFSGTYASAEDSGGFQLTRRDLEMERRTGTGTSFQLGLGQHDFEKRGESASADVASLGVSHRLSDRVTGRARLGVNAYDRDIDNRMFWSAAAEWLPSLQGRVSVEYSRYDLVYDSFTIETIGGNLVNPVSIDNVRLHYDHDAGGLWAWGVDASQGMLSDDNERRSAHGLVALRLLKRPFIAIKGDVRYLTYENDSNRYWSPRDYVSTAGVLQIGSRIGERIDWQTEMKYGRSSYGERESDVRTINARVRFALSSHLDLIGSYVDGESGRIDLLAGGSEIRYWQKRWYLGLRVRGLGRGEERGPQREYYYDTDALTDVTEITTGGAQ